MTTTDRLELLRQKNGIYCVIHNEHANSEQNAEVPSATAGRTVLQCSQIPVFQLGTKKT
jgi:hypothetical protein